MSQHDFNIANQGFPSFRTDLNNALVALATTSSGTAEPATTYANQLWYETDTNTLHIRNEANSGWLDLMVIDQTTGSPSFTAGNVGIGTSAPVDKFTVSGGVVRVENDNGELFSGFGGVNNSSQPNVIVSQSRGTVAAPTETQAGDRLLGLLARGHNGTTYTGFSAGLQFHAEGSGSAGGTYAAIHTAPVGSSTRTERMRIDSSGNVGIGVAPSAWYTSFGTRAIQIGASASLVGLDVSPSDRRTYLMNNSFLNSSGVHTYLYSSAATQYQQTAGKHQWFTAPSGTAGNAITFTQAMTLDASGNLLVGTTSLTGGGSARMAVESDGAALAPVGIGNNASGTASSGSVIFRRNGSGTGSISVTGTTTAYNTSSDYRLKENVAPMQNALDTVAQLNPVTYTWKADGSDGQGFIAHELQAVVPDCVTGEKDAVDAEGNPQYQGVDTSFLVATLVKAIQELKAEVDSLRAQLNH